MSRDPLRATIAAVSEHLKEMSGTPPAADPRLDAEIGWRPHLLEEDERRAWHVLTEVPTAEFWISRIERARAKLPDLSIGIAGPPTVLSNPGVLDRADSCDASLLSVEMFDDSSEFKRFNAAADLIYGERLTLTPDLLGRLLDRWLGRVKTENDSCRKGIVLEVAMALLLSQVRGFEVAYQGVSSRTQQMDVLVHNRNVGGVLGQGPVVIAECKNWSYPVGRIEYDALYRKLKTRRGMARLGLLITTDRFARTVYDESLRDSTGDELIVLIDGSRLPGLWRSSQGLTAELEELVLNAAVDPGPG